MNDGSNMVNQALTKRPAGYGALRPLRPSALSLRSVLRVQAGAPGASGTPACALLFDRATGRGDRLAETLRSTPRGDGRPALLVRVAHPDDGGGADLAALVALRPDAVVASRAESGADIEHLGAVLAVGEAKAGIEDGATGIVAIVETAGALFALNAFGRSSRRVVAIGWDGEALARDLGAEIAREDDGRWIDPCQTARTLTLAAAADAKLPALDSPFATRDPDAFRREAERARRDGFAGKIALDARQAEISNEVFGG